MCVFIPLGCMLSVIYILSDLVKCLINRCGHIWHFLPGMLATYVDPIYRVGLQTHDSHIMSHKLSEWNIGIWLNLKSHSWLKWLGSFILMARIVRWNSVCYKYLENITVMLSKAKCAFHNNVSITFPSLSPNVIYLSAASPNNNINVDI